MKKFAIIALALVMCLAFTVPAMAYKTQIGGWVVLDSAYTNADENYMRTHFGGGALGGATATAGDEEWTSFDMFQAYGTRLYFKFTSDKGNHGALISFRLLGYQSTTKNRTGMTEGLQSAYAYAWWQINPTFKLTVGQQDELLGIGGTKNYNGTEYTGFSDHKPFGNIGRNRIPGARLDAKLTDAFTLSAALFSTQTNGGTGPWGGKEEENTTPRFDIMLTGKIGPLTFMPSYMMSTVQYDWDAAAPAGTLNADDSIDCWAFSLPVTASFGPFSFRAEYNVAQNLGNTNIDNAGVPTALSVSQGGLSSAVWALVGGKQTVFDTDWEGWWLMGEYKFTRAVSFGLIYGTADVDNDQPGAEYSNDFDGWQATLTWSPEKKYLIIPYYSKYDLGTLTRTGLADVNMGEVTQMGVVFQVMF